MRGGAEGSTTFQLKPMSSTKFFLKPRQVSIKNDASSRGENLEEKRAVMETVQNTSRNELELLNLLLVM
jgi:hypothetical protein